jgi:hypothetical protein
MRLKAMAIQKFYNSVVSIVQITVLKNDLNTSKNFLYIDILVFINCIN